MSALAKTIRQHTSASNVTTTLLQFAGVYYVDVTGPLGSCLSSSKFPTLPEAEAAYDREYRH